MPRTQEFIDKSIYLIRDQKVLLDEDLARLYQVRTKAPVQAVKRNINRFPDDFMFQLTIEEYSALRSQIVTLSGKAGRRALPYAFTEHGVAMLSSVLNSNRAVEVNIAIVRTFIKMRQMIQTNKELSERLNQMERKYNAEFKVVFNSIRELIEKKPRLLVDPPKKHKLGFGDS